MRTGKKTVFLLTLTQMFYMAAAIINITFAGLAGKLLAPDPAWSTAPVAVLTLGTMLTAIPASFLMKRFGRRYGFRMGAGGGLLCGLLGALAITGDSFPLLLIASAFQGLNQGFALYIRFAASEAVAEEDRGRAVSLVLTGGVAAAFFAPELGTYAQGLISWAPFAGAYLAMALMGLLAQLPLALVQLAPVEEEDASGPPPRPLKEIARQPVFIAAALNACSSYALMVLVMTATPLAMVELCGFSVGQAADVVKWHVLAMFTPSFFTGGLIARFGVMPILTIGMLLFAASTAAAVSGLSLTHFTTALIFLGVAWNFLFVGGTTLLLGAYRPSERAKAQALNEFLVFGCTAAASFSSGALLTWFGWNAVNYGILPLLALTALATLWYALTPSRTPLEESGTA